MRLIVCENYGEISEKAYEIVSEQLGKKPDSVLGFATGSSPVELFHKLADSNIDFSDVKTFNLDEYYPISKEDEHSSYYFMNKHLYSKVNLRKENIFIPNGETKDIDNECKTYDAAIEKCGGIDLQILGMGQNGHIGYNEPDSNLKASTHLAELTQNTIEANAEFFGSSDNVPRRAISMGLATILRAKKIVLLAYGVSKSRVLTELLSNDNINTSVPATLLKVHPDLTVICDKDASCSCAKLGIDIGGTDVKFAVVDNNKIIHKSIIPTNKESEKKLLDEIGAECNRIAKEYPFNIIGVGTPGFINDGKVTAVNLPFKDTYLAAEIKKRVGIQTLIDNDANCAALGEAVGGSGKDYNDIVLLTLGTGVGGGIIMDKKICHGKGGMGEVGHMIIESTNGLPCLCGQSGCLEQYASVTALVRQAIEEAEKNPDSLLYSLYKENGKLSGKLIFKALDEKCPIAEKVFDKYLDWLVVGIKSLKMLFDPDAIVLAGGITKQKDKLLAPLKAKLDSNIVVEISALQDDAGGFGAANL